MPHRTFRSFAPARVSGPVFFLLAMLALLPACMAQGAGAAGADHQAAMAALSDVKAAIAAIVTADASYATDRNVYHTASQRAINALEGEKGPEYQPVIGTPGDPQGAIGHIDALLDRAGTPVWAAPLDGAEANVRAAVAYLHDSLRARDLMDYQLIVSRALAYLEVAQGRPTETGVLAGLEGALANTVLGVPGGARQADGCADPTGAPAFGTHGGYLAWITVLAGNGAHRLPENPGGTDVTVRGGMLVLHTAAAPLVARDCNAHAVAAPAKTAPVQHAAASPPSSPAENAATAAAPQSAQHAAASAASPPAQPATTAASGGGSPPALYTLAQARAGAQLYASKCVSCHGANMQGVAAPSVAGNDFLTTAQHNGWTLETIRYLVFTMMPLNAAHSLSPEGYASVMAYLLASNCYPAGNTPFPSADQPSFANVKLGPVPGHPPGQNSQGVCALP